MTGVDHLRFAGAAPDIQAKMALQLAMQNPVNAELFRIIASQNLALPQAMLVSGCVYQSIWNGLLGHDPQYGIRDYDLAYFDDRDLSYEAEDVVIKACDSAFADLNEDVEVRNQARVHLWFKDHFGYDFSPLASSSESLTRFMSPTHATGLGIKPDGEVTLHAPFGLNDLFSFTIRPRADVSRTSASSYAAKARRIRRMWPQVTIIPLA